MEFFGVDLESLFEYDPESINKGSDKSKITKSEFEKKYKKILVDTVEKTIKDMKDLCKKNGLDGAVSFLDQQGVFKDYYGLTRYDVEKVLEKAREGRFVQLKVAHTTDDQVKDFTNKGEKTTDVFWRIQKLFFQAYTKHQTKDTEVFFYIPDSGKEAGFMMQCSHPIDDKKKGKTSNEGLFDKNNKNKEEIDGIYNELKKNITQTRSFIEKELLPKFYKTLDKSIRDVFSQEEIFKIEMEIFPKNLKEFNKRLFSKRGLREEIYLEYDVLDIVSEIEDMEYDKKEISISKKIIKETEKKIYDWLNNTIPNEVSKKFKIWTDVYFASIFIFLEVDGEMVEKTSNEGLFDKNNKNKEEIDEKANKIADQMIEINKRELSKFKSKYHSKIMNILPKGSYVVDDGIFIKDRLVPILKKAIKKNRLNEELKKDSPLELLTYCTPSLEDVERDEEEYLRREEIAYKTETPMFSLLKKDKEYEMLFHDGVDTGTLEYIISVRVDMTDIVSNEGLFSKKKSKLTEDQPTKMHIERKEIKYDEFYSKVVPEIMKTLPQLRKLGELKPQYMLDVDSPSGRNDDLNSINMALTLFPIMGQYIYVNRFGFAELNLKNIDKELQNASDHILYEDDNIVIIYNSKDLKSPSDRAEVKLKYYVVFDRSSRFYPSDRDIKISQKQISELINDSIKGSDHPPIKEDNLFFDYEYEPEDLEVILSKAKNIIAILDNGSGDISFILTQNKKLCCFSFDHESGKIISMLLLGSRNNYSVEGLFDKNNKNKEEIDEKANKIADQMIETNKRELSKFKSKYHSKIMNILPKGSYVREDSVFIKDRLVPNLKKAIKKNRLNEKIKRNSPLELLTYCTPSLEDVFEDEEEFLRREDKAYKTKTPMFSLLKKDKEYEMIFHDDVDTGTLEYIISVRVDMTDIVSNESISYENQSVGYDKVAIETNIAKFQKIFKFVEDDDYVVGFGGAMVMQGLRDTTSDIDITVRKDIFYKIKRQAKFDVFQDYGANIMAMDDLGIDIHEENKGHYIDETDTVMINGVNCQSPQSILEGKQNLNRPKDQKDIKKLKKYIASNESVSEEMVNSSFIGWAGGTTVRSTNQSIRNSEDEYVESLMDDDLMDEDEEFESLFDDDLDPDKEISNESVLKTPLDGMKSKEEIVKLLSETSDSDIFLAADYHFSNKSNAKDRKIKTSHNKTLNKSSVFLFLGDLHDDDVDDLDYIENILKSLKGKIKILIVGNNDVLGSTFYKNCGFDYVIDELEYGDLLFTHHPESNPSKRRNIRLNIHGHIHGSKNIWTLDEEFRGNWYIDIFIKDMDYRPISLEELLNKYDRGEIEESRMVRREAEFIIPEIYK